MDVQTDESRVIMDAWAAVLGTPAPGPDANFFECGGVSLKAMQLVARLRKDFGKDITLAMFVEAPTVRKLAARIASLDGT